MKTSTCVERQTFWTPAAYVPLWVCDDCQRESLTGDEFGDSDEVCLPCAKSRRDEEDADAMDAFAPRENIMESL